MSRYFALFVMISWSLVTAVQAEIVLRDDFSNNAIGTLDGIVPDVGIAGVTWQASSDGTGVVINGGVLASAGGPRNAHYNVESELFVNAIITIQTTVDVIGKSNAWIGLASADEDENIRDFGDADVILGLFDTGGATFATNNPADGQDARGKEVFFNPFASGDDPIGPITVTLTYNLGTGETSILGEYNTAAGSETALFSGNVLPTGGDTLFAPDELRYVFLQSDGSSTFSDITVTIVPEPGSLGLLSLGSLLLVRRRA